MFHNLYICSCITCCLIVYNYLYYHALCGAFSEIKSFKFLNTCIIKGMVEIYDIMSITCQNLYHMPYQPSTYNTPQAVGSRGDIGFSG